ncbi:MAG: TIGR04552 family protein [Deltaproteobacteria bacterium]|nr:TIGR04552 family protein [Deltaproteobacteria bacterium]
MGPGKQGVKGTRARGRRSDLPVDQARVRAAPDSSSRLLTIDSMGLKELEAVRLILRGSSVVDWRRLAFDSRAEVDRFLKLHLIDFNDPSDRACAHRILKEAVDYLRSQFHYRVADSVAEPFEIQDLFLYASGKHPKFPRRYQKLACLVLKVMHVIHHMEGRELLFRTPIASSVVHRLVDERVMACAAQLRHPGSPVVEFSGSVKTQHSIITKLLAKRETVAAQVFDKVRYRVITEQKKDVLPVLEYLTRTLFPFNLVVPSQTENSLIDFQEMVEQAPALKEVVPQLHLPLPQEAIERGRRRTGNPFSADSYQVLNFVVDLPIRIDSYLGNEDPRPGRPRIVFSWVEFQVMDMAAAAENERGDSSHERYKARQKAKVLKRLSRGLVLPKGLRPVRGSGNGDPPSQA